MMHLQKIKTKAFTLIEMLVATAVMAILVTIVLGITTDFLNVWTKTSNKLSSSTDAKFAMDIITKDLAGAVLRNNGSEWMETALGSTGSNTYSSTNTSVLTFFSAITDRNQNAGAIPGDICAVAYDLKEQRLFDPNWSFNTFALYRTLVDADDTFTHFFGFTDLSAGWGDTGTNKAPYDPYPSGDDPDIGNLLVQNVVRFQILVTYTDTAGVQVVDDPSKTSGAQEPEHTFPVVGSASPATAFGTPLYADVVLAIVSEEGAKVLDAHLSGERSDFSNLNQIIVRYGKTFTQRVVFQNTPL